MRSLARGIGVMIDHVNSFTQLQYFRELRHQHLLERLEHIFNRIPNQIVSSYPIEQVRAKRICLTWDLRNASASNEVDLYGTTWHTIPIFPHWRRRSHCFFYKTRMSLAKWRKERKERKINSLNLSDFYESTYYHLQDTQQLVGEIGVVSPMRWRLDLWSRQSVAETVEHNKVSGGNECDVSSTGLGKVVTYCPRALSGRSPRGW